MQRVLTMIAIIFMAVGAGLLGGGGYAFTSSREFTRNAAVAEGTVVDLERTQSGRSGYYYPIVRFVAEDGKEYEVRSSVGSNPPSHRRGERVAVRYDPAHPDEAKIGSFFALWGFATILGGMGIVFSLIGGGMFFFPRYFAARRRLLLRQGSPVQTQFQSVERNASVRVNGQSP